MRSPVNPRAFDALLLGLAVSAPLAGCDSPENGRPRGGGPGGDARNIPPGGVHPPSKIDGTKTWDARPKT